MNSKQALSDFLEAILQNGIGRSFALQEGIFKGCNAEFIKAGASVHISVQADW